MADMLPIMQPIFLKGSRAAALLLSVVAVSSAMVGAQSPSQSQSQSKPQSQPLPASAWRVGGAVHAGAGQVGPALSLGLENALGSSIFRNRLTLDLGFVPGYGVAFGLDEQVTANLAASASGTVYAGLGIGVASTSDLIRDYGPQSIIGGFNVSALLGYQATIIDRLGNDRLGWYVEGGPRYLPAALIFGANGAALSLRAGLNFR